MYINLAIIYLVVQTLPQTEIVSSHYVCMYVCMYAIYRDDVGRDVLLTCSSCGHLETLLWLLERRRRFNIDSCDDESHWNGLHRGSYHGHAGLCVSLVKVCHAWTP